MLGAVVCCAWWDVLCGADDPGQQSARLVLDPVRAVPCTGRSQLVQEAGLVRQTAAGGATVGRQQTQCAVILRIESSRGQLRSGQVRSEGEQPGSGQVRSGQRER